MRAGLKFHRRLTALNEFKFDFSLGRIKNALLLCGSPQNAFDVIHVAGSNGKGSVASYLANILSAHRLKTGLYTSPHLVDVKERIVINGCNVKETLFVSEGLKLFKLLDGNKIKLTYFEFLTVLSFVIFRREKVRWAVMEAGLGGRYDATNVDYDRKAVSVITSISLEHTDILGKTTMAILKEKEMIIGKGKAVVNISEPKLVKYMKMGYRKNLLFAGEENPIKSLKVNKTGIAAGFKSGIYSAGMIEPVQAENISTVLTVLDVLKEQGLIIDAVMVKKAIANTVLPGRMSWNKKGYYLSVAHNPAAFKEALKTLRIIYPDKKITYVFSALKDKDIDSIFREASKDSNISFVLTKIDNPRAITIGKLMETIVKYGIQYKAIPDNKKAMKEAMKQKGVVVIGGSFYLVNKFV